MQRLKGLLDKSIKGLVSFDRDLRDYTTFRIGGRPRVWIEPAHLDDLKNTLKILSKCGMRPLVIGSGSNLLVTDRRIDRAVIRLSSPCFKKVRFDGRFVVCAGGCSLSGLIKKCVESGLSGLEPLAGIPGTLGGAIMMNAGGCRDSSIGDSIKWVKVIDYSGRKVSLLKKDRIEFGYRTSGLSKYIILEAKLALRAGDPESAGRAFSGFLKKKFMTQDHRWPNAGCIFKNPPGLRLTSGQLLENCGLKGARRGGAEFSIRHANFIINKENARFSDVIGLVRKGQLLVKKNYGIKLEPEIEIIR